MSESTKKETREEATVRILNAASTSTKYPMKRQGSEVEIGVLRKGENNFSVTKDENIFIESKLGCQTVDYPSIEDVMNDGWLID